MTNEELRHVGIIGMHWGKIKARKEAERKTRDITYNKLSEKNKSDISKLRSRSAFINGKLAADNILNRMGRDSTVSYESAKKREVGKTIVASVLAIGMGAVILRDM